MNYQKIVLIGNSTDEAKGQKPEGKKPYTDFTLAVNRNRDEADFFRVRAFGQLAETAAKIKKGQKVFVEGRVEISRYQPKEGEAQSNVSVRVLANWLMLL